MAHLRRDLFGTLEFGRMEDLFLNCARFDLASFYVLGSPDFFQSLLVEFLINAKLSHYRWDFLVHLNIAEWKNHF